MIFPEISAEEWCKRFPGLEIREYKCPYCRKKRIINIPTYEKDWVGLIAKDCPCGHVAGACQFQPRNKETEDLFKTLFS